MNERETIKQAIQDISIAEAMIDQAKQRYSSAKRKLQAIYAPAKDKEIFSKEEIAKMLTKRPRKEIVK